MAQIRRYDTGVDSADPCPDGRAGAGRASGRGGKPSATMTRLTGFNAPPQVKIAPDNTIQSSGLTH
jgi:hypothetical protein